MRYAGIIKDDIADSITGINVSFWVQGCNIHCKRCHNPQTWDFSGGKELPDNYLDIIDQYMDADGIQRGLSILGGDPFSGINKYLTNNIVTHVREKFPNRKIYIWTGYLYEDLFNDLTVNAQTLSLIDYLIDGPFEIDKRDVTLKLRGSSNQRIIDVPKTLQLGRIVTLDMT